MQITYEKLLEIILKSNVIPKNKEKRMKTMTLVVHVKGMVNLVIKSFLYLNEKVQ